VLKEVSLSISPFFPFRGKIKDREVDGALSLPWGGSFSPFLFLCKCREVIDRIVAPFLLCYLLEEECRQRDPLFFPPIADPFLLPSNTVLRKFGGVTTSLSPFFFLRESSKIVLARTRLSPPFLRRLFFCSTSKHR